MSAVREAWTDERLDDLQAGMHREFDQVRAEMDRRFDEVDRRFDKVDERFNKVDERFDKIDARLDTLNRTLFLAAISVVAALLARGLL
jgi:hypothetical protein